MRLYKVIPLVISLVIGSFVGGMPFFAGNAHAYTQTRLIDDPVFDNVSSMNESQIQSFLAAQGSCLATYYDVDPTWTGTQWTYTGSVLASHTIAKVSSQWGINPQVILSTLQKEQSLISGKSCVAPQINSAMGYDCPDSGTLYDYPAINVYGTCVAHQKNVGLARQVLWAGWQLKFGKERSEGNTSWDGDGDITYVGYMTQGTFQRCASASSCPAVYYSGDATIDGQTIHLENGATASLYSYTPHLNQSFPGIFATYFGSPTTGQISGVPTYRLYNKSTNKHFYTLSSSERDTAVNRGWTYEGPAWTSYTNDYGVFSPVYRLYNSKSDEHFYTLSASERDNATHYGWVYEGIAWYVDTSSGNGVYVPTYRLYNRALDQHFYTLSASERDNATHYGWVYEGIAWYVGN